MAAGSEPSLQERYAPESICFGCGPANDKGLRIRSFLDGGEVVMEWTPQPYHHAFEGMLNGGIIGALLDCHMNWTAAHHLMVRAVAEKPPCTVTGEFSVRFKKPTPIASPVHLRARVMESSADRAVVEATLSSGGTVCATGRGTFVAVKPGHPAYHRW